MPNASCAVATHSCPLQRMRTVSSWGSAPLTLMVASRTVMVGALPASASSTSLDASPTPLQERGVVACVRVTVRVPLGSSAGKMVTVAANTLPLTGARGPTDVTLRMDECTASVRLLRKASGSVSLRVSDVSAALPKRSYSDTEHCTADCTVALRGVHVIADGRLHATLASTVTGRGARDLASDGAVPVPAVTVMTTAHAPAAAGEKVPSKSTTDDDDDDDDEASATVA